MAASAVSRGLAGSCTFFALNSAKQQCSHSSERDAGIRALPSPALRVLGWGGATAGAAAAALGRSNFTGASVPIQQCCGLGTRRHVVGGVSGVRAAAAKEDEYVVTLEKPVGLNFYRGNDGGTYIDKIQPDGSADATGLFTVGDKVLETR